MKPSSLEIVIFEINLKNLWQILGIQNNFSFSSVTSEESMLLFVVSFSLFVCVVCF